MNCFASIYMQKDANGSISYSDVPKNNSESISLSSVSFVPSTNGQSVITPNVAQEGSQPLTEHNPYQSFTIVWPGDNETVQNEASITVRTATNPTLQPGDTIQLFVDGQPWGEPEPTTNITLTNISRGEHSLSAKLYDSNQRILKQTNTVKVFIHKPSLNFTPR